MTDYVDRISTDEKKKRRRGNGRKTKANSTGKMLKAVSRERM